MNITHVVRGNEYLSSTPKYNLIYQAFGWDVPSYIHCPPVMKDEKHKLSKRNGDASYQDLINKGFLNEAILNYIALLGWSPEGEQEIFSLDELIEAFDVKRISKSGAIFDMNKLKWINSQYIKKLDTKQLTELCLPFLQEAYDLSDKREAWIEKLVEVHRDHISCGEEIVEQVKLFFEDEIHLEDKLEQQADLIEQTVDNIYVQELLKKLNEQERQIIHMRYFQNQTQAAIAKKIGISQVQVSRMEKKILNKLRKNANTKEN